MINGLTLREHPCQALADLFTLHERFGDLRGVVLTFVGDGNNVYQSLALMGATMGMEVRLAHPARLWAERSDRGAGARARGFVGRGASCSRRIPREAVRGAAAIYTDAWTSMGQEAETEERREAFRSYQVNAALLAIAPGRGGDALSAGAPRGGDHVRGDGWPAERHLRPIREPAARPESTPRGGARRRLTG